ncbi:MAG: hypothetical protein AB1792_05225 [Candidatus Zixiibacteriota bacterium]
MDDHHPILAPDPDVIPPKQNWMIRITMLVAGQLVFLAIAGLWLHFRPRPFSPARWQSALGPERGRMLKSLFAQTDFVGFTRANAEIYLGPPDFDERQFWYDLGSIRSGVPLDPRAAVGDSSHLHVVFSYNPTGAITDVLYSHRRPTLGSAPFDSSLWFNPDHARRVDVIIRALGRIRARGPTLTNVQELLGPADGARVRAHYDVGSGGVVLGSQKALILDYNADDVVSSSHVAD